MRIFVLLLLVMHCFTGNAQDCVNVLSGKVVDFHDGSDLAGATLVVVGTDQTVQTDLDGAFRIDNLCDATYIIQVSHPYCSTKDYTIKINSNTTKTFRLEHHIEELNEAIVIGKAFTTKSQSVDEKLIDVGTLERFSSGSLGDALNSLSGVSSLNTGNAVVKPIINGLHSSRVVVVNHGVVMEDQDWGAEHAPNLDINTAGHITVIKGASALQYSGDAVGGIIVVEPPKVPIVDSLYGKTLLSANTNGRGGVLTSQLTRSFESGWYASVQGTAKRFGDFEAPDYLLSNTGVAEYSAALRAGLNKYTYGFEAYYSLFKSEIGILRASHLGGAQDQFNAINSDRPFVIDDFSYDIEAPRQEVTHHLARLKGFKRFESLGKLSFQYDFQWNKRFEFDIRRGDDRDKASIDLDLKTHTIKLDLDSKLSDALRLKTGITGRFQDNFANPETGVRRLIPDYQSYHFGAYGVADYRINTSLRAELGGRFDYSFIDAMKFYRTSFWESRGYDELFADIVVEEFDNQILVNPKLHFYNASATAGVTYSFAKNYTLFFNYALASRAPNPSELFSEGLHHSASRIELGDLRFDSEIGHKWSLTLKHQSDRFFFAINPYINVIRDFIVIEPTGIQQTLRGNFQVWEYRQTNARLLGLDVDASYRFTEHLQWNHQWSLVKGRDRSRNTALINMPPVNTVNELVYQNPKINNLRLALKSEYMFEQNEFPDTNFEVFIPETETFETVDISTPPEAYHLLHFNSSVDFSLNNRSTLTVGLAVNNLFDTSYRNYLNRLRFYADELGRNIRLNLKSTLR